MTRITKHLSLDNIVYQELKKRIIEKELTPGEKVNQDQLKEELDVSRTPIQSALVKLEQERLVDLVPRRGFFVRKITLDETVAYYEIREVMEGLAARKAAKCINDEQTRKLDKFFTAIPISNNPSDIKKYEIEDRKFHSYVLEIAHTDLLSNMFSTFNILTISYQLPSQSGLIRTPKETIDEHRSIIEAICNKDAEQAEIYMKQHLRRSRKHLAEEIGLAN